MRWDDVWLQTKSLFKESSYFDIYDFPLDTKPEKLTLRHPPSKYRSHQAPARPQAPLPPKASDAVSIEYDVNWDSFRNPRLVSLCGKHVKDIDLGLSKELSFA